MAAPTTGATFFYDNTNKSFTDLLLPLLKPILKTTAGNFATDVAKHYAAVAGKGVQPPSDAKTINVQFFEVTDSNGGDLWASFLKSDNNTDMIKTSYKATNDDVLLASAKKIFDDFNTKIPGVKILYCGNSGSEDIRIIVQYINQTVTVTLFVPNNSIFTDLHMPVNNNGLAVFDNKNTAIAEVKAASAHFQVKTNAIVHLGADWSIVGISDLSTSIITEMPITVSKTKPVTTINSADYDSNDLILIVSTMITTYTDTQFIFKETNPGTRYLFQKDQNRRTSFLKLIFAEMRARSPPDYGSTNWDSCETLASFFTFAKSGMWTLEKYAPTNTSLTILYNHDGTIGGKKINLKFDETTGVFSFDDGANTKPIRDLTILSSIQTLAAELVKLHGFLNEGYVWYDTTTKSYFCTTIDLANGGIVNKNPITKDDSWVVLPQNYPTAFVTSVPPANKDFLTNYGHLFTINADYSTDLALDSRLSLATYKAPSAGVTVTRKIGTIQFQFATGNDFSVSLSGAINPGDKYRFSVIKSDGTFYVISKTAPNTTSSQGDVVVHLYPDEEDQIYPDAATDYTPETSFNEASVNLKTKFEKDNIYKRCFSIWSDDVNSAGAGASGQGGILFASSANMVAHFEFDFDISIDSTGQKLVSIESNGSHILKANADNVWNELHTLLNELLPNDFIYRITKRLLECIEITGGGFNFGMSDKIAKTSEGMIDPAVLKNNALGSNLLTKILPTLTITHGNSIIRQNEIVLVEYKADVVQFLEFDGGQWNMAIGNKNGSNTDYITYIVDGVSTTQTTGGTHPNRTPTDWVISRIAVNSLHHILTTRTDKIIFEPVNLQDRMNSKHGPGPQRLTTYFEIINDQFVSKESILKKSAPFEKVIETLNEARRIFKVDINSKSLKEPISYISQCNNLIEVTPTFYKPIDFLKIENAIANANWNIAEWLYSEIKTPTILKIKPFNDSSNTGTLTTDCDWNDQFLTPLVFFAAFASLFTDNLFKSPLENLKNSIETVFDNKNAVDTYKFNLANKDDATNAQLCYENMLNDAVCLSYIVKKSLLTYPDQFNTVFEKIAKDDNLVGQVFSHKLNAEFIDLLILLCNVQLFGWNTTTLVEERPLEQFEGMLTETV